MHIGYKCQATNKKNMSCPLIQMFRSTVRQARVIAPL